MSARSDESIILSACVGILLLLGLINWLVLCLLCYSFIGSPCVLSEEKIKVCFRFPPDVASKWIVMVFYDSLCVMWCRHLVPSMRKCKNLLGTEFKLFVHFHYSEQGPCSQVTILKNCLTWGQENSLPWRHLLFWDTLFCIQFCLKCFQHRIHQQSVKCTQLL